MNVETQSISDLTTLGNFARFLYHEWKREGGLIIKARSHGDQFENWYLENQPKVRLDGEKRLIPEREMELVEVHEHFCTRTNFNTFTYGAHIEISKYISPDYLGSGLPIVCTVVNKISAFIETDYPSGNGTKLPIVLDTEEVERFSNSDPDSDSDSDSHATKDILRISARLSRHKCPTYLYSDKKWEMRLPLYRETGVPFAFLPMALHGESSICRSLHGEVPSGRDLKNLDPNRPDIINQEYELSHYAGDLYKNFTWLPREDRIVKPHLDTSLIWFLSRRELPILGGIISNARRRDLRDIEIEFVTNSLYWVNMLKNLVPNAVTEWAFNFTTFMLHDLVDMEVLSICQRCFSAMKFRKGKKFCSPLADGRDCGKKERDRRYYQRHQPEIKKRCRAEMALYREVLKEYTGKTSKS